MSHNFNGAYDGQNLERLTFPIGGLGAGMFCLTGSGALTSFSINHICETFNEPFIFSALSIKEGAGHKSVARVLEGPVASWKPVFPWNRHGDSSGMGAPHRNFGFPRFDSAQFEARFPFAQISLIDDKVPLEVSLVGWSPFVPGDADASGLPVGTLEYRFKNNTSEEIEAVYSFHSRNFVARNDEGQSVTGLPGGFVLRQTGTEKEPAREGSVAAWINDPEAKANLAWFRGGWYDHETIVWKTIAEGQVVDRKAVTDGKPSPGGSVYLPLRISPGEERTVRLFIAWYVPFSTACAGPNVGPEPRDPKTGFYRPWYATEFKNIEAVVDFWNANERRLYAATRTFTDCFYDNTLPPEVTEAVASNLSILKSPTVMRQFDGRMWAWEGSTDEGSSCAGTCTHVWNYAQAVPHLFPTLERGLREMEFNASQDERGHQNFRSALPIGPTDHDFHAAADGQLGGIIKVYRDWRIAGDLKWLRSLWSRVKKSLDYCIETWDPDHRGILIEPHHNTYDIEFWGPDGMTTSFYLGALHAAVEMGRALGEDVAVYEKLRTSGKNYMEKDLFNGEYFLQKVQWKGLRASDPVAATKVGINMDYSEEALAVLAKEGPKYQYGEGCLSDGIIGEWMAWAAGLDPIVDPNKIGSHLLAVHKHNLLSDLSEFANPQRSSYALGHDAGLLLCTWPHGGQLSLPFPYSNEVWTGIEYQVASHLISRGHVQEGLDIVRACRSRYDGTVRSPFNEFECGSWYARALASYALLQAFSGARYDAVEKVLYLAPKTKGDFRSFLATNTGFGAVGVRDGTPFFEAKAGQLDVRRIQYDAAL
jgi:uncharacterized protein (DUF608 family)